MRIWIWLVALKKEYPEYVIFDFGEPVIQHSSAPVKHLDGKICDGVLKIGSQKDLYLGNKTKDLPYVGLENAGAGEQYYWNGKQFIKTGYEP